VTAHPSSENDASGGVDGGEDSAPAGSGDASVASAPTGWVGSSGLREPLLGQTRRSWIGDVVTTPLHRRRDVAIVLISLILMAVIGFQALPEDEVDPVGPVRSTTTVAVGTSASVPTVAVAPASGLEATTVAVETSASVSTVAVAPAFGLEATTVDP
jgi:hypothetical protein